MTLIIIIGLTIAGTGLLVPPSAPPQTSHRDGTHSVNPSPRVGGLSSPVAALPRS